jgi:hypothetical protein
VLTNNGVDFREPLVPALECQEHHGAFLHQSFQGLAEFPALKGKWTLTWLVAHSPQPLVNAPDSSKASDASYRKRRFPLVRTLIAQRSLRRDAQIPVHASMALAPACSSLVALEQRFADGRGSRSLLLRALLCKRFDRGPMIRMHPGLQK